MKTAYIACRVFPGLFENEYYVTVNGSSAYYVSRSNVRLQQALSQQGHAVDGQVLSYIVETDADRTLIQLPGEVVVGGLRTWVENTAIVEADS